MRARAGSRSRSLRRSLEDVLGRPGELEHPPAAAHDEVAAVTVEEIARHAARAIPAGLPERTVGVVDGHRPAATSRRADDQDAVRADATPTVAELADAVGGQFVRSFDDHEIVSAALHLGELHAAASTIAGSGSVAVGSNQRIAGSRRNQVIWRRE